MTAVFLPLKEEELIGDFLSSLSFWLRRPGFPKHRTHHNYVLSKLFQKPSVLSSGSTQHPSREQSFHHWLQGSHSSRVSGLAIPHHCPLLPLLQPLFVPCPSFGSHPMLVQRARALCTASFWSMPVLPLFRKPTERQLHSEAQTSC